jgi:hypothetical protein
VHHFPTRADYDAFYTILLRLVNIAFEDFARYVQALIVNHLLMNVSAHASEWYETYWTGARGRYCICHSTHGGTNNNMGTEVDWRDFKKICPASSTLGTLIGCECHFIKELGKEHEAHLAALDTPNAFISDPIIPKSVWDEIQDMHPKTLACIFIITGTGKKLNIRFQERVEEIFDMCDELTPLHLKIEAWHKANPERGSLTLDRFKTIMIPRQHILKTLDPEHTRPVAELRKALSPMKDEYLDVVIDNEHDPAMELEQVLDVYETFHHLTRDASWGKIPLPCSCVTCHAHCVCKHGTLFTSIFDPEVAVPKEYVAAQPRLRKKTQKLRGTAGPKRARLIAERRRESEKTESKLQFLEMEGCGAAGGNSTKSKSIPAVIPDVIFPSSESDDDFMEVRVALPRLELSF